VDVFLAIASKRDVRAYSGGPLPPDVVERILDAGRLAGSSQNRQPWTFVVLEGRERVEQLAGAVYEPGNVLGAALVVAIVVRGRGPTSFDAGRAATNMQLAAWNEGVVSCPNGIADEAAATEALDVSADDGERIAIVLTFGYPHRPRDPERRSAAEWSVRARRKPLADVVRRLP
jgi:nitroreductase